MCYVKERTDNHVFIFSNSENQLLKIGVRTFERAKGRKERHAQLRNPVEKKIAGRIFVFKRKEWKDGLKAGRKHQMFSASVFMGFEKRETVAVYNNIIRANVRRVFKAQFELIEALFGNRGILRQHIQIQKR